MTAARSWLLAILLLAGTPADACTTFCLADSGRILFGRNFDYYVDTGRVLVNRRGLAKSAFWTNSGFHWVSRFGSVSFNQFGHEMPNGGINEAGLVVEHMMLDGSLYPEDARPDLTELQWIQYLLDTCASVEEVLATDERVRITAGATPLHFLVADRGGRCAVIEFLAGRRVCHVDGTLPVAALTNHSYDTSLAFAAATPPAQADHVSSLGRFVHAAAAVQAFPSSGAGDAVGYAFATLAAVAQPNWTRWSIVYDIGGLSVSFRTQSAPAIKRIRLDRLDFRPAAPTRMMDINAAAGGEVTPQLYYSPVDNLAVITDVFRRTAPLAGVSTWYLQQRAAYPDTIVPAALPAVLAQPQGRSVNAGEAVELVVGASPGAALQWYRNGWAIPGATGATLRIAAAQPADAGVYTAELANEAGTTVSDPAVVGLVTGARVLGAAREYAGDIRHAATGNTYDQFLLTGAAASLTADPGQIARISFIDLSDDIVQVEFSGPGTLTLLLDAATGPAPPRKYNQQVDYMRGQATVILSGATADTHVAVYSVGVLTYPAVIRPGEDYDGHADLATLAVQSRDGRLAEIRCGNAAFCGEAGAIGILAPGVTVAPGPVNVHDLCAAGAASARLEFGSVPLLRITGGDLYQINGGAVRSAGIPAQGVVLAAGTSSADVPEPARPLRGRIESEGRDASADLVVPPSG